MFNSTDSEKLVELLNFVARHARFHDSPAEATGLSTDKALQFSRLLNYAQTVLLPKIESHRIEVNRLIEPEKKKRKPSGK